MPTRRGHAGFAGVAAQPCDIRGARQRMSGIKLLVPLPLAAAPLAGVAAANIQTTQVSLDPVMSNDGTSIVGYTASDSIAVTKLGIAKAGSVVDAAVGAGANGVSGPSLSLSSQDALYDSALKAAVAQ